MQQTNMTLAQNIKTFRKQNGLTQEEFAEKLGVTFQAVSKRETAKSAPDVILLPLIAETFGCSIDDLFSYLPKNKREPICILPGDQAPDELKAYVGKQLRYQLDRDGSTDPFLTIMEENLSGNFELTDENIDRLLDAYRAIYKGMQKK